MKTLICALALTLTLASQNASAAETRKIDLQTVSAPVTITLDESSLSYEDEFGHQTPRICRIKVKVSGLAGKAFLAATAAHSEYFLNAGRWCQMTPLESLVAEFRNAGGSLTANAVLKLSESRYEVLEGHGEPENLGKCNRNLQESVDIQLPLARRVGSFQERRLQTTSLRECFN